MATPTAGPAGAGAATVDAAAPPLSATAADHLARARAVLAAAVAERDDGFALPPAVALCALFRAAADEVLNRECGQTPQMFAPQRVYHRTKRVWHETQRGSDRSSVDA